MYTKNFSNSRMEVKGNNGCSAPIIRKPFKHIVLTVPSSDLDNFNTVFYVQPQYINQALHLANAFQGAIDPLNLNFNFEKALQIANGIPNSAIVKTLNQSVIQQTVEISVMVEQLKKIIQEVLGLVINSTSFWNSVEATIKGTFTNLDTQIDEAWIFWHSLSAHNTSYYYNILFSIQNEDTGAVMAVLPLAFEVSVDVEKQKVLFFTIKDSARYEVKMKALTLVQALHSSDAPIVDIFNVNNYNLYHSNHKIIQNLNLSN
uniref:Cyt2Aa n=1 Tax=Bacillus thuringiensis TaxID=1428 RepID=B5ABW0_BACTU|nr:Cyt2Aa [Bacillus thuringiensis]